MALSAYERAAQLIAAGEQLRQKRLASIGQPPPDPYGPEFRYIGGSAMTGSQTQPAYKDAYTRVCEQEEEMNRRRWARVNGEPRPDPSLETAQRLADRLVDPDRPQTAPPRDPRISASTYVLADRIMPPEPEPAPRTYRIDKPLPPADFNEFDTDGQE